MSKTLFLCNFGKPILLLQEYLFVPLDIFRKILHNKGIRNQLDAWLTFLSSDEPEIIEKLILAYPSFQAYYQEIYELCRDTERMMEMFSKELQELDRNTVQYMIDEMQEEIDEQKKKLDEKDSVLSEQKKQLDEKDKEIARLKELLSKS